MLCSRSGAYEAREPLPSSANPKPYGLAAKSLKARSSLSAESETAHQTTLLSSLNTCRENPCYLPLPVLPLQTASLHVNTCSTLFRVPDPEGRSATYDAIRFQEPLEAKYLGPDTSIVGYVEPLGDRIPL